MLLTPSERAFVDQLAEAKVPIKAIQINPDKTQPITPALQAILSKSQELKVPSPPPLLIILLQAFNLRIPDSPVCW